MLLKPSSFQMIRIHTGYIDSQDVLILLRASAASQYEDSNHMHYLNDKMVPLQLYNQYCKWRYTIVITVSNDRFYLFPSRQVVKILAAYCFVLSTELSPLTGN